MFVFRPRILDSRKVSQVRQWIEPVAENVKVCCTIFGKGIHTLMMMGCRAAKQFLLAKMMTRCDVESSHCWLEWM